MAGTLVREASAPVLPVAVKHASLLPDAPTLGFDVIASAAPLRESVLTPRRLGWAIVSLRLLRLLYLASVLFALLRLATGVGRTVLLERRARAASLSPAVEALWDTCRTGFAAGRTRLLASDDVVSPATMTLRRPVVVIPSTFSGQEPEMAAAFCHELAHVRRGDFRQNLVYELLAAPLFFHPAAHAMLRRMQETRGARLR